MRGRCRTTAWLLINGFNRLKSRDKWNDGRYWCHKPAAVRLRSRGPNLTRSALRTPLILRRDPREDICSAQCGESDLPESIVDYNFCGGNSFFIYWTAFLKGGTTLCYVEEYGPTTHVTQIR